MDFLFHQVAAIYQNAFHLKFDKKSYKYFKTRAKYPQVQLSLHKPLSRLLKLTIQVKYVSHYSSALKLLTSLIIKSIY